MMRLFLRLHNIGAKVHGVETVPTRLVTGGQEMLGSEATFVYNDREKNQGREYWRVNIRYTFKTFVLYTSVNIGCVLSNWLYA
jgi:hypothetical protein